ncbi:MAG: hypothetical protein A3I78_05615 [Gammaproteobacteria bacterium RIFCSPLOWO2_02_FULL_56_15]|nr:MAG: hypothetical protein A3I78_05615 [Gammaproteobacteria bacterium RIFCSPLOWO2_02_FULL_56_15]
MNNRDYLIEMMSEKQLDRREVAELLIVKRETVDHWLLPNEASHHEEVPDMAIELLRIKMRDRIT